MNVLITLPKDLIEKIISGEKKYEMRKFLPKFMRLGLEGFFVVEKGTDNIRCWCRLDAVRKPYIDSLSAECLASSLCVSKEYIENYVMHKNVYLWKIGKVIVLKDLKRNFLAIFKNPQRFAYCPLSSADTLLAELK